MSIEDAIKAVAASNAVADAACAAWQRNSQKLQALGATSDLRLAAIFGQCAHESGGFLHMFENLNYSTDGLQRVFRKYFLTANAADYARKPEKIANRVYANRMGNGPEASGDGWRFRGRGFIQLTGRATYQKYGKSIDVDLEADPDKAADLDIAWQVAVTYMASTVRSGKSALQWADLGDDRMVTLCINGGDNGLVDRQTRTARAVAAISGDVPAAEWQQLLLAAGFNPGPIDGLMGNKTKAAREQAEAKFGLKGEALVARLRALENAPVS